MKLSNVVGLTQIAIETEFCYLLLPLTTVHTIQLDFGIQINKTINKKTESHMKYIKIL